MFVKNFFNRSAFGEIMGKSLSVLGFLLTV